MEFKTIFAGSQLVMCCFSCYFSYLTKLTTNTLQFTKIDKSSSTSISNQQHSEITIRRNEFFSVYQQSRNSGCIEVLPYCLKDLSAFRNTHDVLSHKLM